MFRERSLEVRDGRKFLERSSVERTEDAPAVFSSVIYMAAFAGTIAPLSENDAVVRFGNSLERCSLCTQKDLDWITAWSTYLVNAIRNI